MSQKITLPVKPLQCNYNLNLNVNYDILEREMKASHSYSDEEEKELEDVFIQIYQVMFMKAFGAYTEQEDGSYLSLVSEFKERIEPVLNVLYAQLNECDAFRAFYAKYCALEITNPNASLSGNAEEKEDATTADATGQHDPPAPEFDPELNFVGLFGFEHFPKMHRIIVSLFLHSSWDETSANAILQREEERMRQPHTQTNQDGENKGEGEREVTAESR